jgi:hypothetical protein
MTEHFDGISNVRWQKLQMNLEVVISRSWGRGAQILPETNSQFDGAFVPAVQHEVQIVFHETHLAFIFGTAHQISKPVQ